MSIYKIAENSWSERNLPDLNVARGSAGGCHVGDYIYVIGGISKYQNCINSIEKLNLTDLAIGKAVWKLIKPSQCEFSERMSSVVAAINSEEIAILGGVDDDEVFKNDIFIFNTRSEKFSKSINSNPVEFIDDGNQTVCFTPNTLNSIVLKKEGIPVMIEFTKGANTMNMIEFDNPEL